MRPGLIGIAFGNAFDRTSLWSVEADTPNIDLTSFGESTSVSGFAMRVLVPHSMARIRLYGDEASVGDPTNEDAEERRITDEHQHAPARAICRQTRN
jgi:hypothetical protein